MVDDQQETRSRGILSPADREYLRGEKQLSPGSERNTRLRIRERVRESLTDFKLLWSVLPDEDLEQIFYPDDENEKQDIRSATQYAFAFLLLGLWANQDPHPGRLEDAFQQAAFESGQLADVNLDITTEQAPSGNLIPAKIQHKEERIQELRERLEENSLTESKQEELMEELRQEVTFSTLLFEEALVNPSADAEAVASLQFDGEETEIRPEDVEKNQQVWNEHPTVRKSLPIITDVKPATEEDIHMKENTTDKGDKEVK